MLDDRVSVSVSVDRGSGANSLARSLRILLEWSGSCTQSTYHVYFDARPDPEALRARYQDALNDSNSSPFYRRVAVTGLKRLNERLEKRRPPAPKP
jgi:hypothetical protein